MNKDEILAKSRAENAGGDEREKKLRVHRDAFMAWGPILLGFAMMVIKLCKGQSLILRNNLKAARTEKGLSQSQLAELVGVSRNTISSIETGQFNPTAKLALILCIALDKKFEDLFYF